jgi:TPR repeat protein
MRNKTKTPADDSDFLSRLVLWRNDPGLVEEILPHARAGNSSAQYAMGLIYAEGRGVTQDTTQAYLWLTRAVNNGDEDAGLLRSVLMHDMSLDEIKAADQILTI